MDSSSSSNKKNTSVTVTERKNSADAVSIAPSLKSPRTARFAEATSVNSPIEPSQASRAPWQTEQSTHYQAQPQPGDVGFGYVNDRRSTQNMPHVEMPLTPATPLLKSAMKSPGISTRNFDTAMKSPTFIDDDVLKSPTWKEEKLLEKRETRTEKTQRQDLKVKVRVRMAKFLLRFTNFSCSLIVLAMLATTLTVFNATIDLPERNGLPPWEPNTPQWPQLLVLCIACVSLFASVVVIIAMCRGGRKMQRKWQTYYSVASASFFTVSIIIWAIGAGVLQHSKATGEGKDMWGWACKQNAREKIFGPNVDYASLCRMQNWSLVCCLIEVVVEIITIFVYGIVFYRFWSKRKLRNTMAARDKARSQLYQSQARSGANTPYGMSNFDGAMSPPLPLSPREGGYNPMFSPRFAPNASAAEEGQATASAPAAPSKDAQFASLSGTMAQASGTPAKKPFVLQLPPKKIHSPKPSQSPTFASPDTHTSEFSFVPSRPTTPRIQPLHNNPAVDAPAAPGEQTYGAVPIPGAYAPQTVEQTPAARGEPSYGAVPIPDAYAGPGTAR